MKNLNELIELLKEHKISFQEILDHTKTSTLHFLEGGPGDYDDTDFEFEYLLKQESIFRDLAEDQLIFTEEYKDLFNKLTEPSELSSFTKNSFLFMHIVESKIVSFKELVDKYLSIDFNSSTCLGTLLCHSGNYQYLINNNLMSKHDCRYMLDNIQDLDDASSLCANEVLLKYCFDNFLIDSSMIEKFNEMFKRYNYSGFFEYIKHRNENEEFLTTLGIFERIYGLRCTDQEKQELLEICRNSDRVRNNLKQLVESNLESQYDFNQLKDLIMKDEKKRLKLNF